MVLALWWNLYWNESLIHWEENTENRSLIWCSDYRSSYGVCKHLLEHISVQKNTICLWAQDVAITYFKTKPSKLTGNM